MSLNKEKAFFIFCSFVLVMTITIYSVASDKPDVKPVISTYTSNNITKETVVISESEEKTEISVTYPIDINFATKEELYSLNGIGETLSERIIEYRKSNYFYSIEDITKVDGIGEKFLKDNSDKIFVDTSKLPENTNSQQKPATEVTTVTTKVHETTIETIQTTAETTVSEIASSTTITTETTEPQKEITPVNLNTATYEELISLPISPEVANEIIELRDKIGYFSSTEELCYIKSFSRELYIELLKYVYV